ncbi:ArsR family transcriptional regulator [Stagnimonas aquatica]|uniref:ArsR family transcriptional regulator n=1 Tax=Stagnimonas aquatica TaxID=2689987 RepID=A0A3N0V7T2_9GAMM|nr:ArsR family transcriptional regulator [Stagnimonas aquatica]ROH88634.1 ArsR family transcriptional regulator [Stagnimonas aquatica]
MSKTYAQVVTEERRLQTLRLLAATKPDYRANSAILRDGLRAEHQHALSRDQMHTELAWLQEQGLLILEVVGSAVVASLTSRGLDVAEGTAEVPGVKRASALG